MIALTLYSRPGCHLCEDMKATIARVAQRAKLTVTVDEVDISRDPALESRYGQEIPVLMVEGKKVAKYRIEEDVLARVLRDRRSGTG